MKAVDTSKAIALTVFIREALLLWLPLYSFSFSLQCLNHHCFSKQEHQPVNYPLSGKCCLLQYLYEVYQRPYYLTHYFIISLLRP